MVGVTRPALEEMNILRSVVALYIETGEPVSSRMVKRFYRVGASTANIRKVLHRLEELGFLYKPHVSAGRVPSDLGYRAYVDGLTSPNTLDRELAGRVERRIGQEWSDIRDVMSVTSQLLSELTSYMGLTVGLFHRSCIVERLDIVGVEGAGALVILRLAPGMTRKAYVQFARRYPAHIVERAARVINERVAGHPLEMAPERLESFLRESGGSEREIAEAVCGEAEYLFDWAYYFKYDLKRIDESHETQELTSKRNLQRLVRLMGERSRILSVLRGRMGSDITVTIGRENKVEELEDFALVTRRFASAGCDGVLGILGPTRMTYGLVFSLLDRIAGELHRVHLAAE
jgi:heat-inducible transcriptional repressor